MKNILLPTDLSLASLYPVHEICKANPSEPCNIYIVHTLNMPTGIADLLFLQQRKPYDKLSPQVIEAMELLRKKYASTIRLLSFEFLWGNSRFYLSHYMEAREISAVYILKDHPYNKRLRESTNFIPSLMRCKVPLTYVDRPGTVEFGTLTTLLYKEKMPA